MELLNLINGLGNRSEVSQAAVNESISFCVLTLLLESSRRRSRPLVGLQKRFIICTSWQKAKLNFINIFNIGSAITYQVYKYLPWSGLSVENGYFHGVGLKILHVNTPESPSYTVHFFIFNMFEISTAIDFNELIRTN